MLAVLHIHSRHSYDSVTPVKHLIRKAAAEGIAALAITDHDTMGGALEAVQAARGTAIQIIPGAEYLTDCGDILGLFLKEEIKLKSAPEVVRAIREQGGISILPHPYHAHRNVEELAGMVDLIEVFNGRCSPEQNRKAEKLAAKFEKPCVAGPDAHFASEMVNAVMHFEHDGELTPEALLHAPRSWSAKANWNGSLQLSQAIKAWKKRDCALMRAQFRPFAKNLLKAVESWM